MLHLLFLPVVWGHADGQLVGIDVHELSSGQVGVQTSFGLLWEELDDDPVWLCHEAITAPDAPITPRYAISESGTLLGLVSAPEQTREEGESLYRTTDGCDWSPVAGLTGETLAEVTFDPTDSMHVLVSTASTEEGATNGLFRSTDGGLSFVQVLERTERVFGSVQISSAGGLWASAVRYETGEGWVYTSTDGVEWTERSVPVPIREGSFQDVDVVAASAVDPQTAWLVVGPYGDDILLRTADGGETYEEVFGIAGDILDGAVDADGGVWLAVSGRDFYYAADGDDFTQVKDATRGMGVQQGATATWLAIDGTITGHIAQQSVDGQLQSMMHLSVLQPTACPADSHTAVYCEPLWPELAGRLPLLMEEEDTGASEEQAPDTAETEHRDTDTRCGCGGKGAAAAVLPLFFLGLRRRD